MPYSDNSIDMTYFVIVANDLIKIFVWRHVSGAILDNEFV